MTSFRERFIDFPWIPSFVVSLLASLVLFFVENPHLVPSSIKGLVQIVISYGIIIIAVGGLAAGCLSLYYNYRQKVRWKEFEKELEKKSENRDGQSDDVTKSPTDLLIDWIDKVEDLIWISDNGEVTITAKNLNDAQKIILYLIGVRYAFELGLIESPEASSQEIAKKAKVPFVTVNGWYLPLDDVINKRHLEIWERYEKEDDPFDKYQLNMENVDKAFHYVTDEADLPDPILF